MPIPNAVQDFPTVLRRLRRLVLACVATALVLPAADAGAFTQSAGAPLGGKLIPMGHEWLTVLSALELLDPHDHPIGADDPRKKAGGGMAAMTDLSAPAVAKYVAHVKSLATNKVLPEALTRYGARYQPVLDAVIGERWVDIGGFNVTKGMFPTNYDCWDAVAQLPDDVQYDHFCRRPGDHGGAGGVTAIKQSRDRFIQYFIDAAMAGTGPVKLYDGGSYSTETTADRNYLLFGRVVHLFEDSFSGEHAVRIAEDHYKTLRQVKSYLCTTGSEQHTHQKPTLGLYRESGDVIWKPGSVKWTTQNLVPNALAAVEGMKDLWAAFFRTMAVPMDTRKAKAQQEAVNVANGWLHYSEKEVAGWYDDKGHQGPSYVEEKEHSDSLTKCIAGLGEKTNDLHEIIARHDKERKICLFNIKHKGTQADFDKHLHMPFDWGWTSSAFSSWKMPPADYKLPEK